MPAPNDIYGKTQGQRPRTGLTASGQMVNSRTGRKAKNSKSIGHRGYGSAADREWQEDLWHFFDVVGEFEFVANWSGNIMSRARLSATYKGQPIADPNHPANVAMAELFGSDSGRSEGLKMLGIHYTVAGDAMIVSWVDEDKVERWEVVSPFSLTRDGSVYKIGDRRLPDENPLVVRTWRRHPRDPNLVHSPAKASLPILSEIDGLTKHIAAQTDSRLTSNGLLVIPNEVAFSSGAQDDPEAEESTNDSDADKFVAELIDVASQAISDRSSAAAKVPIVMTTEGEHVDKIKWIKFWSDLDKAAISLRAEAIRRLALSLDIPPEALLGSGDANHWSMWSVDESSIKSHIEPNLMTIASDLIEGYLRPAIKEDVESQGESIADYEIAVDTSDMRLRPNRSKEALELYDRGEVNAATLRRETGFDPLDVMDDKEFRRWLLKNVARGSSTPEMMMAALRTFGLSLKVETPTPETPEPEGREERPAPSTKDHPRPELTDPEDLERDARRKADKKAQAAALYAMSEQVVFRAMERAGNRLKNRAKFAAPDGVESSELYLFRACTDEEVSDMLQGGFSQLQRFAGSYGVDADALEVVLADYCRSLMSSQRPHTRDALETALESLEATHV